MAFEANTLEAKYQPKGDYCMFVFSETGCPACNNTYLSFIVDNVMNKEDMYIYSAALGMRIDISPLLSDTIGNLIEGNQSLLDANGFTDGSYFLEVKSGEIDTVIKIEANSLYETLNFIKREIQY